MLPKEIPETDTERAFSTKGVCKLTVASAANKFRLMNMCYGLVVDQIQGRKEVVQVVAEHS